MKTKKKKGNPIFVIAWRQDHCYNPICAILSLSLSASWTLPQLPL